MLARLPETVDPWLLAARSSVIAGEVDLARLPRTVEVLSDRKGVVQFELDFSKDEKNRVRITGYVRTQLGLECQRCLELVLLPVDSKLDLVVIEVPAEAERIPATCEPVIAEDGRLSVLDLIEEELLLAIPQIPMHDAKDCSMDRIETIDDRQKGSRNESETVNPFAILSNLKSDSKN